LDIPHDVVSYYIIHEVPRHKLNANYIVDEEMSLQIRKMLQEKSMMRMFKHNGMDVQYLLIVIPIL